MHIRPWSAPRKRRLFSRWLGSFLMLSGAGLAAYPYYPSAQFAIQKKVSQAAAKYPAISRELPSEAQLPDTESLPTSGQWLVIPSIGVREEVIEGKSLDVLSSHEGVWHQAGDLSHNLVLAGHRFQYLPPNTHTFYNLNKLKPGDLIRMVWKGESYTYVVQKTSTVTADHVEIADPTADPHLTLYTCEDWAATERFVVVAVPLP